MPVFMRGSTSAYLLLQEPYAFRMYLRAIVHG